MRWIASLLMMCIGIAGFSQVHSDCKNKSVEEIRRTEADFVLLTLSKGESIAFYTYADEQAVKTMDTYVVKGRDSIAEIFKTSFWDNTIITWVPDAIEVSDNCDLGYTWGRYTYAYIEQDGNVKTGQGIFHTIWKKQADGSWKFVWD